MKDRDGRAVKGRSARVLDIKDSEQLVVGERQRECPVPKPGGRLGEILGFLQRKQAVEGSHVSDAASMTSRRASDSDQ